MGLLRERLRRDEPILVERIRLDGHRDRARGAAALALLAAPLRPVLLYGAMRDKDWASVLRTLGPVCTAVHFAPLSSERAALPEDLRTAWPDAVVHPDFPTAWISACAIARACEVPLLAAGSFHLVGGALRELFARGPVDFWPQGIQPDPTLPAQG
jgi:folylpolyglutamate synthase/dihydropteroate synthase